MSTATKRLEWWLKEPERYWIRTASGFHGIAGRPVRLADFNELDAFLHKAILPDAGWQVSCGVTGLKYAGQMTAYATPEKASEKTRVLLISAGLQDRRTLRLAIQERILEYRVSPRYELEEVEVEE